MPAFTSILAIASLALGAGSAIAASNAAHDAADKQDKIYKQQAAEELAAGQDEADAIRRKAAIMRSAQEAALAGSGITLGQGTAADLLANTDRLAEIDVLAALKDSSNKAKYLKAEGGLAQDRADSASTDAALSFGGQAVNTASQFNFLGAARPAGSGITLGGDLSKGTKKNYSLGVGNVKDNSSSWLS